MPSQPSPWAFACAASREYAKGTVSISGWWPSSDHTCAVERLPNMRSVPAEPPHDRRAASNRACPRVPAGSPQSRTGRRLMPDEFLICSCLDSRGEGRRALPFGRAPGVSCRVRMIGVNEDERFAMLEWWRVVAADAGLTTRPMLFIEEQAAGDFARQLGAGCFELVLVEHWRNGEQVELHLVGRGESA